MDGSGRKKKNSHENRGVKTESKARQTYTNTDKRPQASGCSEVFNIFT